ncbi:hypothetical protein ACFW3D_17755 [Streptomyces sp. NPDC058864]
MPPRIRLRTTSPWADRVDAHGERRAAEPARGFGRDRRGHTPRTSSVTPGPIPW